jgi:hypothetical protein
MTLFKVDDATRTASLRDRAEKAIALALRNKWTEATEINRSILEETPDDVDALNRSAKALLELAEMDEARETLKKVALLAPGNIIGQRNVERLTRAEANGADQVAPTISTTPFSLDIFMEEAGKSTTTPLIDTGDISVFQRLTGGEQVELVRDGDRLLVQSRRGDFLGRVPPRLARRLVSLMDGGNRYAAAALHFADEEVRVIIRELHQDPSQAERPSFPPQRPDGFRPYVRGRSLVYYDLEEAAVEVLEDADESEEQPDPDAVESDGPAPKRGAFEASADDEDESE